jgi:hypothetical protein
MCDDLHCNVTLTQKDIKQHSLLDRRWQCVMGRHYCPKHHKTAQEIGGGCEKYVEYWSRRLAASSQDATSSPSGSSSTHTG